MEHIIISGFLGLIGFAYLVYGKKRPDLVAVICGLGLMVVPYIVKNLIVLGAVGLVMCALPFIMNK